MGWVVEVANGQNLCTNDPGAVAKLEHAVVAVSCPEFCALRCRKFIKSVIVYIILAFYMTTPISYRTVLNYECTSIKSLVLYALFSPKSTLSQINYVWINNTRHKPFLFAYCAASHFFFLVNIICRTYFIAFTIAMRPPHFILTSPLRGW